MKTVVHCDCPCVSFDCTFLSSSPAFDTFLSAVLLLCIFLLLAHSPAYFPEISDFFLCQDSLWSKCGAITLTLTKKIPKLRFCIQRGFNTHHYIHIFSWKSTISEFGSPYLGKALAATRAVLPSPTNSCNDTS